MAEKQKNGNSVFVQMQRVLVIDRKEKYIRIKNGDAFLTCFFAKSLPALPSSVGEGSQISVAGFIRATFHETYGLSYSLTTTKIIELSTATAVIAEDDPEDEPGTTEPATATK